MQGAVLAAVWGFWREYGTLIAERQTTIWLVLIYVGLIGPTWLFARIVGKRFFVEARPGGMYWQHRRSELRTIADMRRMG
jgi:hypothetical protein